MFSLTPLVKRLLIAWAILWVVSFLSWLADSSLGLSGLLAVDPRLLSGEWWRVIGVVGYALVHDPTWPLHMAINAYLFAVFGPEVETLYSGRRFIKFLLVATLAGAVTHLLFGLFLFRPAPAYGGSGLVSAVIAVNAAIYPDRILNLIILRCRMITFFLVLLGLDLVRFLLSARGFSDRVAFDIHLAGAAAGWMWAGGFERFDNPLGRLLVSLRGRQAARSQQRQRKAQAKEQAARQAEEKELDRILAKISREGMPALTDEERKFLERRSKQRT